MFNAVEMNDLFEVMSRNYYQVWVSENGDANHMPIGFGSGFMFLYNGHLYYITADHVVNAKNEKFKLRSDKDYVANIPTNKIVKGGIQPLAEQIYFNVNKADGIESIKVEEDGSIRVEERVDFYYRNIDEHMQTPFYTQGLQFSADDVRYEGLQKTILTKDNIEIDIDPTHTFSIFGMTGCYIKGFTVMGSMMIHQGMTFVENKYGQYCLAADKTDEHLLLKDWAGLSGAAVYDECTDKVIGMALQYSEAYNYCWVLPIRYVFNFVKIDANLLNNNKTTKIEKFQPLIEKGVRLGQYPEFLYKYRTLASAIRSLEEPSFYASSILKFNDPYEGHFVLDANNTQLEWETFISRERPLMPFNKIKARAQLLSTNANEAKKVIEPHIHEALQNTGVFCLQKKWDSILTWSYYAEDHKGICIEYKPIMEEELCSILLPVHYSNDYVKFNYLRNQNGPQKAIIQKAKCWAHEEELRVLKPDMANKSIRINPQAITSIILGCRFEEGIKNDPKRQTLLKELVDILREPKYNHLQIKQCIQKTDRYELTIRTISLSMLEALLPPKRCRVAIIMDLIRKWLHLKRK